MNDSGAKDRVTLLYLLITFRTGRLLSSNLLSIFLRQYIKRIFYCTVENYIVTRFFSLYFRI